LKILDQQRLTDWQSPCTMSCQSGRETKRLTPFYRPSSAQNFNTLKDFPLTPRESLDIFTVIETNSNPLILAGQ
jgi:hypothetical protein